MRIDERFFETEQQHDARMEEEGHFERLEAVHRAKNLLLQCIREAFEGDGAYAKTERSKLRVEIIKDIAQDLEMEHGDTLPNEVIAAIIEEVFKLSKRKGWNT